MAEGKTAFMGVCSGAYAAISLENILHYASVKSIALQQLAESNKLTSEMYHEATATATRLALPDLVTGIFFGALSGCCGALAIYYANGDRKD